MELSQRISTGILQLLLTVCVACGSAVIDAGINLYFSIISTLTAFNLTYNLTTIGSKMLNFDWNIN